MDIETGGEEEVIPLIENEYVPKYSPDGKKVVWITFRHSPNGGDIYIANLANPNESQFRVTSYSGWGEADWSPDGSKIVSSTHRYGLVERSFEDMPKVGLPEDIVSDLRPLKNKIFEREEDYLTAIRAIIGEPRAAQYSYKLSQQSGVWDQDLWIIDADGSNLLRLTSGPKSDEGPCWARVFEVETDLMLLAQASQDTAASGEKITFTITVTNNGAGTAKDVVVSNELSPEAKILSISATRIGVASGANNRRAVTFSTLAPNQSETITIVVRINRSASGGATISNSVTTNSARFDANTENNSAIATMRVSSR